MKEKYNHPQCKIEEFKIVDVITTSNGGYNDNDTNTNLNDDDLGNLW